MMRRYGPFGPNFGTLRFFRESFYRCLDRRIDPLLKLTDALPTAGSVPARLT